MSRYASRKLVLPPEAAAFPDPAVTLSAQSGPFDFAALFGRRAPVEIEIGFGKGRFLLDQAGARPDTSFLGIEYAEPYFRLVRARVLQRLLPNVRLIRAQAADVLARLVADASVHALWVLFPDPWPKLRHHKRRLVNTAFCATAARILAPGGRLHIATDHQDYARVIELAAACVPQLEPVAESPLTIDLENRTHFAAKLAARGAHFSTGCWVRRP